VDDLNTHLITTIYFSMRICGFWRKVEQAKDDAPAHCLILVALQM